MNLGIENLKVSIAALINFGKELENDLQDKKLKFIEVVGLSDNLKELYEAYKKYNDNVAEALDLDDQEKVELHEYLKSECDLLNDEVEGWIKRAFALATEIYLMIRWAKDCREKRN